MKALELLAPARTADIGIAAIDCGADAVYIGPPAFGARQAAGNSIEDIARLCEYAHKFGARIFATVNTLLRADELDEAQRLVRELQMAGVDALIVQDPAVLGMGSGLIMHASTQCAIRSVEKAQALESMGFGRLVLERQLSLEQIRAISSTVNTEIEFFVHGALCVCYSGQCYLSEYLTGRSANRGECAQPCRNLYDLEDASGKVLVRNKALLSLKDYNLLLRLEELADAGVSSFKIEGRLKGESYVRNVVTAYSQALDALVARHPDKYCRASFGHAAGGFVPDVNKTFNRGYTELFLDGRRGSWASIDAPKAMGGVVGKVGRITPDGFVLNADNPATVLSNGDGFAFVSAKGEIVGFRADVCNGLRVQCRKPEGLKEGTVLYRNLDVAFEKKIAAQKSVRAIDVDLAVELTQDEICCTAISEDGRKVTCRSHAGPDIAKDRDRMLDMIRQQLGKRSGVCSFKVSDVADGGSVPFMSAAFLNGVRRELAQQLETMPVQSRSLSRGTKSDTRAHVEDLNYRPGMALMRSKYCVRHQLGLCPKQGKAQKAEALFLINGKERLKLSFNCAVCEMTVTES